MKPQFALSLSFDDIALLIRSAEGWHVVSQISPDEGDLPTELAILRSKAEDLAGGARVQCKLLLPDALLRYLTIETGDVPREERLALARKALEGATPYPVDALTFDISSDGPRTHVVAVAHETLAEAEDFAIEHGFGPVSFVASPGPGSFVGEPFFGATRAARGIEVEPDDKPVVILGPLLIPEKPKVEASAPTAETETEAAPDALPPAEALFTPIAEQPPTLPTAPAAGEIGGGQLRLQLRPEDLHEDETADTSQGGPIIGFSSRRSASSDESTPPPLTIKPVAKDRQEPSLSAKAAEVAAATSQLTETLRNTPPEPVASLPAAPTLSTPGRSVAPAPVLAHTTSAPAKTAPPKAHPVAGPVSDMIQSPQARPLRTRQRRLGLVAALLATVTAVGAWALARELPSLWTDLTRADLVAGEDPVATPVLAHAPAPTTAAELAETAGRFSSEAASDGGLTGADSAVLEALGAPSLDESQPVDGRDLVVASLPAPRTLSDELPGIDDPLVDEASLPGEDTLDPEALADGITGEEGTAYDDGSTAEAAALQEAAQYAATGIWQRVPEVAQIPPQIDLEDVYVASIDRTDLSQDAIALPGQTALDTDQPFGTITNPSAAGRQFALDDRGLVTATKEGTVNPDGITVYLGRPIKEPPKTPNRPTASEQADAEAAAQLALLQKVRPRTRPGDLVEQTERVQLGGVVRSELLSKRPKTRPESLKTEEEESQPATEQAVAFASKPRARPANFANIVDRAQRSTQSAPAAEADNEPEVASVAPASVSPSIPSSASVARQATEERALNLRRINLIGVYGKPSDRRALVRLPSGRYVKVKVGDRIDGGRIVAIGETQLQYQKGGKNTTLKLPNG
ncbi:hypothetical protein [Arenibacterium sp. LLYu02]|uniref:hypothetical protein n=1 Tax=Arenibacterium sp. LLYu02 TaxID=3404132 RepID=UPI003B21700E